MRLSIEQVERLLKGRALTVSVGEPWDCAGVGLSSSQSVYQHRGTEAKSIRLTERGWQAAGQMPLMGRAAGRGLEVVASEESYALAAEMLAPRTGGSATSCGWSDSR